MIPRSFFHAVWSALVRALAPAFVFLVFCQARSFAATDWTAIQSAMQAPGTPMPGDVLRFELARQDLSFTVNGQAVPFYESAAVSNGFVAFRSMHDSWFFVDGSLPAQESEVGALESALRVNPRIRITAVAGRAILESPKLVWVHFEATGDGAALAASLATALATIQSPQINVEVKPGTNTVFDPSILPPQFLKLFDEGFVEQLQDMFAFYLPRPDERQISLGNERAESGLGVCQSFYIQIDFSGGTNATLNVEFALRGEEVQAVSDALRAGGFTITSQANNFLDDNPHLYFVHATGSGDGFTLGNALYNAVQIIQADSGPHHDHNGDD